MECICVVKEGCGGIYGGGGGNGVMVVRRKGGKEGKMEVK